MTKPIASVALMQLYERGKFQLLDPVHRYIPEWRTLQVGEEHDDGTVTLVKPQRPMNIRDVLMHTTGLPGSLFPDNPIDAGVRRGPARAGARPDTRERHRPAGPAPAEVPSRHPLELRAVHRHRRTPRRDPLGPALRRVPAPGALRAARHDRHRVLRPRGDAAAPGRLLPVPPGQHAQPDGGRVRQPRDQRPHSYLSGAGGLVSTTARLRRLLPDAGERGTTRRSARARAQDHRAHDGQPPAGRRDAAGHRHRRLRRGGFEGVGFGLGFAVGLGPAATAMAGSAGEYYWGGAASTAFWVDPAEDLFVVFMTQLFPSIAYPFRAPAAGAGLPGHRRLMTRGRGPAEGPVERSPGSSRRQVVPRFAGPATFARLPTADAVATVGHRGGRHPLRRRHQLPARAPGSGRRRCARLPTAATVQPDPGRPALRVGPGGGRWGYGLYALRPGGGRRRRFRPGRRRSWRTGGGWWPSAATTRWPCPPPGHLGPPRAAGPGALRRAPRHLGHLLRQRFTHGTPFRRAWEEGLLLRDHSVHVGLRGPLYSGTDLAEDSGWGSRRYHRARWPSWASQP